MATLGTPKEAQRLDNLSPIISKRYIHHYVFPKFSAEGTFVDTFLPKKAKTKGYSGPEIFLL